jgi:hypothetical protein
LGVLEFSLQLLVYSVEPRCEAFSRRHRGYVSELRREGGMVGVVGEERGCFGGGILGIIEDEFGQGKVVGPIVLLI